MQKKFQKSLYIVPAVTIRKIHGKAIVSFYRIASLTADKYLRRIIQFFLVSHCLSLQYLQYSQNLQYLQNSKYTFFIIGC